MRGKIRVNSVYGILAPFKIGQDQKLISPIEGEDLFFYGDEKSFARNYRRVDRNLRELFQEHRDFPPENVFGKYYFKPHSKILISEMGLSDEQRVLIEDTLDQSKKELLGLLDNLEIVELNSGQRNKYRSVFVNLCNEYPSDITRLIVQGGSFLGSVNPKIKSKKIAPRRGPKVIFNPMSAMPRWALELMRRRPRHI
jgi:hypothetical protein